MIKVKTSKQEVIHWQAEDGLDIEYNLEEGRHRIFFNLQKNLPSTLKIKINLLDEGSEVTVRGLIFGQKQASLPWQLDIHHRAANTGADVLVKGILKDQASAEFKGLIKIDPDCSAVESFLAHHTILLSEQARVSSVPSLEIESNEVKASHASTVHFVDPEMIFYLESRGLALRQAEQLIVKGFLEAVKG